MTSGTQVLYPIVAALVKAEDILGPHRTWQSSDHTQHEFLAHTFSARADLARIPDITSIAARDADTINKFLAERGFQIKLDPFTDPSDFGTASVLDVLVEWATRGTKRKLQQKNGARREYPGVRIEAKGRNVFVFRAKQFVNPIAVLETKSGDEVWLTVVDSKHASTFFEQPGVVPNALQLPSATDPHLVSNGEFGGVHFPMVSFDHQVDISWLRGLGTRDTGGVPAIIKQAFQQTRFRMNDVGARAESAVAIGAFRSAAVERRPQPDLVIDEPFLLWIRRKDCRLPLFVGYFDTDTWKDPGTLGR
ncbi:hypothetical protein HY480_03610 [Candidatus Uhrbacteria bacterium]|nr:hypothetical protein [Candidatus Uhrbacteria bacterium]